MSRNRDEDDALPRFKVEDTTNNNQDGAKSGASNAPTLEDLMGRLEKLTA
jgi:hypothetical protein